jgi:hypothetical protein
MADFDDISLHRAPEPDKPAATGPPLWPPIAVGVLILALLALWYVRGRTPAPANTQLAVAQTTVDLPKLPARLAAEPGEAIDLPPLDQSDAIVRTLAARLSSHPTVAAWLTTDQLIRNITVVVANIADGQTPAKHLRALRPAGSFTARQSGGLTWLDAAGYRRYDSIADGVESLDGRGVARFYATVKPRIAEAYRDLGGGDGDFDRTLERAIVQLLRTPVLDHDVQLRTGKMSYEFADPALEGLSKAQRQFLRMGPRNMRIVRAKLREVARYLGIPDTALPPGDAKP